MSGDDILDLQPGTVLAGTPYRVLKRLGGGGMGALFEGEHVRLKRRRVAIKTVHPGLRGRADFLARMEIEGQTLARLDHPGIVKIFDLGVTDDGIPYFVMERLEGKDLRKILQARRFLDYVDALSIAGDALQALAHAHREGIVHRDIKPENLFLAVSGAETVTKVLDFGIASVADDKRNLTGQRFVGTTQYAAPEQLRGEGVTERTDIYAMGCVLFELVTGRRPFPGPGAMDYARQHLHDPAPRLSAFLPVPRELDELVASALEKEPDKRPISALWFASQIHQLLQRADGVALATANTTQEMLLTAVTEGVPSSARSASLNDTVRDRAPELDSTAPDGSRGGPLAHTIDEARRGPGATVPLAPPRKAATDLRAARTRTADPPSFARTEEVSPAEQRILAGTPTPTPVSMPPRASTGGVASVDVAYSVPKVGPRLPRRWGLAVAGAIFACGAVAAGVIVWRGTGASGDRAAAAASGAPAPPSAGSVRPDVSNGAPSSLPGAGTAATPAADATPVATTAPSTMAGGAADAPNDARAKAGATRRSPGDVGARPAAPAQPAPTALSAPRRAAEPQAPRPASPSDAPAPKTDIVRTL